MLLYCYHLLICCCMLSTVGSEWGLLSNFKVRFVPNGWWRFHLTWWVVYWVLEWLGGCFCLLRRKHIDFEEILGNQVDQFFFLMPWLIIHHDSLTMLKIYLNNYAQNWPLVLICDNWHWPWHIYMSFAGGEQCLTSVSKYSLLSSIFGAPILPSAARP